MKDYKLLGLTEGFSYLSRRTLNGRKHISTMSIVPTVILVSVRCSSAEWFVQQRSRIWFVLELTWLVEEIKVLVIRYKRHRKQELLYAWMMCFCKGRWRVEWSLTRLQLHPLHLPNSPKKDNKTHSYYTKCYANAQKDYCIIKYMENIKPI